MRVVCALNEILAEKQMSKRQLAREAGVTPNAVCNLARVHRSQNSSISMRTLNRICMALQVNPGDILKFYDV